MGKNHLQYGNTSSSKRQSVQLLSNKAAKSLDMDPYTIGVSNRPLKENGYYNVNPDYEDIYNGNQTVVTSQELKNAILNSPHNQFEYSSNGIVKNLYIPNSSLNKSVNDNKIISVPFKRDYSHTYLNLTNQQWDNLYNTAIKSGNLSEVQKLRDLHFKTKADMIDSQGNPIHEYHGSPEENLTELLSPSDPRMPKSINTNFKATGQEGIYLSPVKSYAARYTADLGGRYRTKLTKEQRELIKSGKSREEIGLPSPPKGRVYDFYSNTRQVPLNSNLTFNPMTLTSADRQAIEKAGYSGFTLPSSKMPEHVVFKSNQLKLSDPITYDDSGNIIPLSKRDNFNNPDIRYGLIPFLGFGAYSQYSKNK